jgi:hypothetical protein
MTEPPSNNNNPINDPENQSGNNDKNRKGIVNLLSSTRMAIYHLLKTMVKDDELCHGVFTKVGIFSIDCRTILHICSAEKISK